jgi:lactoylglutathione lyase
MPPVDNSLVPELLVSDLQQSLRFYRDTLGFRVEYERPEDKFAFLSFQGSRLMLEQDSLDDSPWRVGPLEYPRGRGLNLSIGCPDASDLARRLEQAGFSLRKPVQECWYRDGDIFHGQRNFLVLDPDGYLLRFAEHLGTKPVRAES